MIDKYRQAEQFIHSQFGRLDGYAAQMYKMLGKFFKAIEGSPRGYEYAFLSVEHARLDRRNNKNVDAKKYGAAAVDVLSTLPNSEKVEKLLYDAAEVVTDACNDLDDWSGIDQLKVTRINYELSQKYPSNYMFGKLAATINYADALLEVDQLSGRAELQKFIVNNCLKMSEGEDNVALACKLRRILLACGSKKRARKMHERILLNRIENCAHNIDTDCFGLMQNRQWNLAQADEVIGLLKKLGREEDVRWWTAFRELLANPPESPPLQ